MLLREQKRNETISSVFAGTAQKEAVFVLFFLSKTPPSQKKN